MSYIAIFRVLGAMLMLFSCAHIAPMLVSNIYQDGAAGAFMMSFIGTFIPGMLIWVLSLRQHISDLSVRDGFIITSLFWLVLGLFGALPFILDSNTNLSVGDAVFESISGLTTTGATTITQLGELPKSILFYRQQLQWLGGIGIIVIAVAVLPMLGIGGMQLYKAEMPGPIKDSKITPRITETAKWLFFVYTTLTLACAICYFIAGMSVFDAVTHSFSTVAIGGFSTHDSSMAFFDSDLVLLIATAFMFISGFNFALHYYLWMHGSIKQYLADSESVFYFFGMVIFIIIAVVALQLSGVGDTMDSFYVTAVFQVVSIATTTGFTAVDFSLWPGFVPLFLILLSCMGGCAGSTGGGVKVIRILLLAKQAMTELKKLIHPNAVVPVKLHNNIVPPAVMNSVWGFLSFYGLTMVCVVLLLQLTGMDGMSAISAGIATLNNLGPGLGDVAHNYGGVTDAAKWIMCLAMLLGRLEIFTLLILFTPSFWRA